MTVGSVVVSLWQYIICDQLWEKGAFSAEIHSWLQVLICPPARSIVGIHTNNPHCLTFTLSLTC